MQETRYWEGEEGQKRIKHLQEFFSDKTQEALDKQMDVRFEELKARGHELVRRIELNEPTIKSIGRNAPCPCGSGHKYKRCCMKVR
jgi:uncharacterized protein YecA (UPF0149 family)